MANDLESDWKKLNLAEADDEVINFDPDQEDDVQAQVSLCLIEKPNIKNAFNLEAMKQTMHNVWRLSQGLVITELEHPNNDDSTALFGWAILVPSLLFSHSKIYVLYFEFAFVILNMDLHKY